MAGALGATIVTALNVAAGAYLAFLVLWGFNYQRTRPAVRYGVDSSRVTPARVAEAATAAATALNRDYVPTRDDSALTWSVLVTRLQPLLDDTARDLGVPWRARGGVPKWSAIGLLFPRAGVDGMVNPIGLEVIPNPEVLPFERPFVLAHEWAHLAGAGEESEASFVAWMVCLRGGPDSAIQRLAGAVALAASRGTARRSTVRHEQPDRGSATGPASHRCTNRARAAVGSAGELGRVRPLSPRESRSGGRRQLRRGGPAGGGRSGRPPLSALIRGRAWGRRSRPDPEGPTPKARPRRPDPELPLGLMYGPFALPTARSPKASVLNIVHNSHKLATALQKMSKISKMTS